MTVNLSLRILLADDHPVVREGLALILDNQSDMTVVGQARDGREAVELFCQLQPDVTLMDLRMPQMSEIVCISILPVLLILLCELLFLLKLQEGGWVFLRAILDEELLETINGMIYFQKWRDTINYKFPFESVSSEAQM